MADPKSRELQGVVQDNPLVNKMLDAGNWLRYGMTEKERMDLVNRQAIPGIKDVAYNGPHKIYDPAAAERYGSAYLFAKRWPKLTGIGQGLTKLARGAGSKLGIPGVGEERPELTNAMKQGMYRGKQATRTFSPEIAKQLEDDNFTVTSSYGPGGEQKSRKVSYTPREEPKSTLTGIADGASALYDDLKMRRLF